MCKREKHKDETQRKTQINGRSAKPVLNFELKYLPEQKLAFKNESG